MLVAALGGAFAAVTILGVGEEDLRAAVEPFGAAAPLVYVAVAVVLGLLLVPGAVLAAGSGLLFGALLGALVSIVAATVNAVIALQIARRGGRPGVEELSGPRLRAFSVALERHGLAAVVAQRLAPAVPDGPMSYAAGLLGVRTGQIALGTLIGAAPRAGAYASLGAALDDPVSAEGAAGVAGLVLTGIVGLLVARHVVREARRTPPAARHPASETPHGRTEE